METVSDLKNIGTGSKRRRICENYEQSLFDNMKELKIAIHGKVETDNPELSENLKYCSADTPLHETLEKSNKSFKNECNIGKGSKKETVKMTNFVKESGNKTIKSNEILNGKKDKSPDQDYNSVDCKNKLKVTKGGRNSISSMPHKEAVKTNDRKLSLNISSQDLKENYEYSNDISPINKKKYKNQNLNVYQDRNVITRSMIKYNSPQTSNDEKVCSMQIRDNTSFSNDQSSSEQDCEELRYPSNFPVVLATTGKLKKKLGTNHFEMYCSEDSLTNSSEESNVSVKENVRMSSKKQNLKNSLDSKATYSENETISPSSITSNLNSYSEEYDQNEEISEDSFTERKVKTKVSKRFAPNEKSKSSKYPKLNSKVAKLASLDLLNEEQHNLASDDHEESLKLDYSPIPAKSVRRKSQRTIGKENKGNKGDSKTKDMTQTTVNSNVQSARSLESMSLSDHEESLKIDDSPIPVKSMRRKSQRIIGKENRDSMTNGLTPTVNARSRKSSSHSESQVIFDSPEQVKSERKKSLNKRKSKNETPKANVRKISRATPKRLSLALETYMQDTCKPELGLSWDKNCTPPRRFSLRLKKEPGSDTPRSNKSYLSLGNTPRYSLRKRYTGTSTDSEENTKIKSESNNSKVKKINLNNSDGAFETDSDVEIIKPSKRFQQKIQE